MANESEGGPDRPFVAGVAEWFTARPSRARRAYATFAVAAQVAALAMWLMAPPRDIDAARATLVLGAFAVDLIPPVRMWFGGISARRWPAWLVLDVASCTVFALAIADPNNPTAFEAAVLPIALAFLLGRVLLGWVLGVAYTGVMVTAVLAFPAVCTDGSSRQVGLWIFWSCAPLVLACGPFMVIASVRGQYEAVVARRGDMIRLEAEVRRTTADVARRHARRRSYVHLHGGPVGWLQDVSATLDEVMPVLDDTHRPAGDAVRRDAERLLVSTRRLLGDLTAEEP